MYSDMNEIMLLNLLFNRLNWRIDNKVTLKLIKKKIFFLMIFSLNFVFQILPEVCAYVSCTYTFNDFSTVRFFLNYFLNNLTKSNQQKKFFNL